jgi:hypothetical protein
VWINGALVAKLQFAGSRAMGFGVMTAEIGAALRVGRNTIAIEAVRGYGSHHHTNALKTSWLNSGEVLAVKVLPAAVGLNVAALLLSDSAWKSTVEAAVRRPG